MQTRNFLAATFIGGPLHTERRRVANGTVAFECGSALYRVAPSHTGSDGQVDPSRDHVYFTLTSWSRADSEVAKKSDLICRAISG